MMKRKKRTRWETIIDFTKIKKGGVSINKILKALKDGKRI